MRATFFQAVKLFFALLGFVGIMVGYRGSDYPIQANPSPVFRPTPVLRVTPSQKQSLPDSSQHSVTSWEKSDQPPNL